MNRFLITLHSTGEVYYIEASCGADVRAAVGNDLNGLYAAHRVDKQLYPHYVSDR